MANRSLARCNQHLLELRFSESAPPLFGSQARGTGCGDARSVHGPPRPASTPFTIVAESWIAQIARVRRPIAEFGWTKVGCFCYAITSVAFLATVEVRRGFGITQCHYIGVLPHA